MGSLFVVVLIVPNILRRILSIVFAGVLFVEEIVLEEVDRIEVLYQFVVGVIVVVLGVL